MSDEQPEPAGEGSVPAASPPARRRIGFGALAPQRRQPPAGSSHAPGGSAAIINGLDRRESIIGAVLAAIALLLAVVGYHVLSHSTNKTLRPEATVFLIATLIGAVMVLLGTALRRRALLGFGCFLVGLELFTYRLTLEGLLYLGVGGWLIFRVMQYKKLAAGAGDRRPSSPRQARTDTSRAPAGPPKASKRYTPPKRAAAGRRR